MLRTAKFYGNLNRRHFNYSSCRSLSRQAFTHFPEKVGLYDSKLEKDSCGVGLVAHLKKNASRQIVVDANEMLVRMSHRGACGCEPNTGDGAGEF